MTRWVMGLYPCIGCYIDESWSSSKRPTTTWKLQTSEEMRASDGQEKAKAESKEWDKMDEQSYLNDHFFLYFCFCLV